jgi:hypothetical protein
LRIVDARICFRGGRCWYNERGGGSEISMCCELTACLRSTMPAWIPSCFASILANAGLKRSSSFLVKSQQTRCARSDVTSQPFHLQYDIQQVPCGIQPRHKFIKYCFILQGPSYSPSKWRKFGIERKCCLYFCNQST